MVGYRVSERIKAKLDTGASITAIPERLISSLELVPVRTVTALDYKGTEQQHQSFFVHLVLNGMRFDWVEVVSARMRNLLVGRDILNRLKVTLDGKNLSFEVCDP